MDFGIKITSEKEIDFNKFISEINKLTDAELKIEIFRQENPTQPFKLTHENPDTKKHLDENEYIRITFRITSRRGLGQQIVSITKNTIEISVEDFYFNDGVPKWHKKLLLIFLEITLPAKFTFYADYYQIIFQGEYNTHNIEKIISELEKLKK